MSRRGHYWPMLWAVGIPSAPPPFCLNPWQNYRDIFESVRERFDEDTAWVAIEAIHNQIQEGGMARERHISEYLKTGLANSGRVAGTGIMCDRYDEESGLPYYGGSVRMVTPSDFLTDDERKELSGEVKVYKLSGQECDDCQELEGD